MTEIIGDKLSFVSKVNCTLVNTVFSFLRLIMIIVICSPCAKLNIVLKIIDMETETHLCESGRGRTVRYFLRGFHGVHGWF